MTKKAQARLWSASQGRKLKPDFGAQAKEEAREEE